MLAAPLVLAASVLFAVVEQEARARALTPRLRRWLLWTPRVLLLGFVAFLALLSLDVFVEGRGPGAIALGLLLHNLPALVLLGVALLAWRWPWVGALGLAAFAAWWLPVFAGRGFLPSVVLLMAVLPLTVSALFLLSWSDRWLRWRPVCGTVPDHVVREVPDGGPPWLGAGRGRASRSWSAASWRPRRRDADALPDGVAGRRGRTVAEIAPRCDGAWTRCGGCCGATGRRARPGCPTGHGRGTAAGSPRRGGRSWGGWSSSTRARRRAERGLDDRAAGRPTWPGRRATGRTLTRRCGWHLHRADYVCKRPGWSAQAQGRGAAGVGKKRLRVEALLAAAASPPPPPFADLVPDPTLGDLLPEDLPAAAGAAARGRPVPAGRGGGGAAPDADPRLVPQGAAAASAGSRRPGRTASGYGFGLVDWRDGWLDWALADGRRAAPFCAQLRRALARSAARGRVALVLLDNLSIHTPRGSRLLRALLAEVRGRERLVLVYTPTYDPDSQPHRVALAGAAPRRHPRHQRRDPRPLLADADEWARDLHRAMLRQIGSPFAGDGAGRAGGSQIAPHAPRPLTRR